MSKIIIGIHGLGNKPPKDLLSEWWYLAIKEGLKNIGKFHYTPKFEMVYWADILNDKPLDKSIKDKNNQYYIDEPYIPSELISANEKRTKNKFYEFLEEQIDKLILNKEITNNFDFLSDIVFKKYFRELEIYFTKNKSKNDNTFFRDVIRKRLSDVLIKHKGKEILLVAHSMGSIIAYDVINLLVPEIAIDTFVTIGSPLGIPIILNKTLNEQKFINPKINKLKTPPNITRNWFNLADNEDNVALNHFLENEFDANLKGIKVQDLIVKNDYEINGFKNPHKSYGYLRSPEFSKILSEFLLKDTGKIKLWWLKTSEKINNFLNKTPYK